jgi:hypothetical protein
MAAVKPFSFNGNLKGEILLANGSRVLFDAPKWEFSYPAMHNSGYCTIKAEECPNQDNIYIDIDGKQLPQKIRDMQSQSIKINVELTEEGKRAVKEAVLGKVEDKHSKPPVGSWDDWDKWVKDVYALLWEYAATFPWETELKDRADLLLEHVPLEKEPAKKQEESTALFDVIGKAVLQHSGSTFTANSGNIAMTYLALVNRWNITEHDEHGQFFHNSKGKDFIECFAKARKIDLSKGWRVVNISGVRG